MKKYFLMIILAFSVFAVKTYGYTLGNRNSSIKIVEFSDYQCPYCRRFELNTFPYIYNNFIKKGYIEWQFKDYPLVNIHAFAYKAAKYADCSGKNYMLVRYYLYNYQNNWKDKGNIYAVLKLLGIPDLNKIKQCAKSNYPVRKIKRDMKEADKLGINSTPSFAIYKNGRWLETIHGYYDSGYWYATLVFLLNEK